MDSHLNCMILVSVAAHRLRLGSFIFLKCADVWVMFNKFTEGELNIVE